MSNKRYRGSVRINLSVSEDMGNECREAADREGIPMVEWIRGAIRDKLDLIAMNGELGPANPPTHTEATLIHDVNFIQNYPSLSGSEASTEYFLTIINEINSMKERLAKIEEANQEFSEEK